MQSELNVEEVVNDRSMKVRLTTRISRNPLEYISTSHTGHYLLITMFYFHFLLNKPERRLYNNCLFAVRRLCQLAFNLASPFINSGVDLLGEWLRV